MSKLILPISGRRFVYRLVAAVMVVTACDSPTVPRGAPDIEGTITEIRSLDRILIDSDGSTCSGFILNVNSQTSIVFRNENGALRRARTADLRVGQLARGWWVGGDVGYSCPPQALAAAIEITSTP
jgi:hypothetical protein